ncbi:MAG: hypothetical protein K2P51_01895 [Rhabdochlamydiaceae bacterium]|nr:hypothetical protein [Rhabdochlamydiaceae bacterium]
MASSSSLIRENMGGSWHSPTADNEWFSSWNRQFGAFENDLLKAGSIIEAIAIPKLRERRSELKMELDSAYLLKKIDKSFYKEATAVLKVYHKYLKFQAFSPEVKQAFESQYTKDEIRCDAADLAKHLSPKHLEAITYQLLASPSLKAILIEHLEECKTKHLAQILTALPLSLLLRNIETLTFSDCGKTTLMHILPKIAGSELNALILKGRIGIPKSAFPKWLSALKAAPYLSQLDITDHLYGFSLSSRLPQAMLSNLADLFRHNTSLTSVSLDRIEQIEEKTAQDLGRVLAENTRLIRLHLGSSILIDNTAARHIANALETNSTLKELKLQTTLLPDPQEVGFMVPCFTTDTFLRFIQNAVRQDTLTQLDLFNFGMSMTASAETIAAWGLAFEQANQMLTTSTSLTEVMFPLDLPSETQEILDRNAYNQQRRAETLVQLLFTSVLCPPEIKTPQAAPPVPVRKATPPQTPTTRTCAIC